MRSFIAIELPESVKTAISALQNELKKCGADVRWVRPEGIHLTLKFLGDVKEKDVDGIVKSIEGTCKKYNSFNVEIKGTGVFPNMKSPRVLWIGVSGNEVLLKLQKDIEEGMASLGFEKENRQFSPHLTFGRFKSLYGKEALMGKIEMYRDRNFGSIEASSISLMRSDLNPAGARYTRISEFKLYK